jgi:hypothetical protein
MVIESPKKRRNNPNKCYKDQNECHECVQNQTERTAKPRPKHARPVPLGLGRRLAASALPLATAVLSC